MMLLHASPSSATISLMRSHVEHGNFGANPSVVQTADSSLSTEAPPPSVVEDPPTVNDDMSELRTSMNDFMAPRNRVQHKSL